MEIVLGKQGSGIRQAPQSPIQNSSSLPVPAAPVPDTDLGDSFLHAGPFLRTQGEVCDTLGNWSCCMVRLSSLMPFAEFHSLLGLDRNIIKQGAVTLPPTQAGTLEAMLGSMEDLSAKHGGEDTGQNTEHRIS